MFDFSMKTLRIALYEGSSPASPPKFEYAMPVPMETPDFFKSEEVRWTVKLFGFWKISIIGRIEIGVA